MNVPNLGNYLESFNECTIDYSMKAVVGNPSVLNNLTSLMMRQNTTISWEYESPHCAVD
jgi:hypothetical protein